ncbi:uncharacterized protein LOC130614636 isoform X2 [Hydractinia symbiolongicarpus]|nr:uncharacterized protein LOC130614636 isoform X2 [Hydractinia symbiolongicarpus]
MLHRLILTLKVKCSNKDDCHWFGELGDLDDHLQQCVVKDSNIRSVPFHRRQPKHFATSESIQNDLLLMIAEQVSSLETKLNGLAQKQNDSSINSKQHQEKQKDLTRLKHERKESSSRVNIAHATPDIVQKLKSFMNINNENFKTYLTLLFIVLLVSLFCITASVFHSMDNNSTDDSQSKDSTFKYFDNVLQEMSQKFNGYAFDVKNVGELLNFIVQQYLYDIRLKEDEYMNRISLFYSKQNRTINKLERHFSEILDQSSKEINKNITLYDHQAKLKSSVENVASLQPLLHSTASYLNKKIFSDLNDLEYEAMVNIQSEVKQIKYDLEILHTKLNFLSKQKYLDKQRNKQVFSLLKEMLKNVTETYHRINQTKLMQVVQREIDLVKFKYDTLLAGYYANISIAFSYEVRFHGVMSLLQNLNISNGAFIWQINTPSMLDLDNQHAFFSPMFTPIPQIQARLLLYKDETKEGYWKLTYIQHQSTAVSIRVLILNPKYEEQLLCSDSLIGELQNNSTAKVNKYFSIPLTVEEMKSKSFIYKSNMFIKTIVTLS